MSREIEPSPDDPIQVVLPGLAPALLEHFSEWTRLSPQFERRPFGINGTRLYGILSRSDAYEVLYLVARAAARERTSGRPDAVHRANALDRAKLRLEADLRVRYTT